RVAVRRLELRHRAQGQAGILGAVPSRGLARPARQPLSVRAIRHADAGAAAGLIRGEPSPHPASCLGNKPFTVSCDRVRWPWTMIPMPTAIELIEPLALMFEDDGSIPNNPRLPLLVYRNAIDISGTPDRESVIEAVFAEHGWGEMWRNGIYP